MITKEEVAAMSSGERRQMSHGQRKHFKGKMGRYVKVRGGAIVVMRAHTHGGGSPARAGWTCDDTKHPKFGKTGEASKSSALGKYRVTMPSNRVHYIRPS